MRQQVQVHNCAFDCRCGFVRTRFRKHCNFLFKEVLFHNFVKTERNSVPHLVFPFVRHVFYIILPIDSDIERSSRQFAKAETEKNVAK